MGTGVKLTTHLHLEANLRMRGAVPPLPHTSSLVLYLVKQRNNFNFTDTLGYQPIFWSYNEGKCRAAQIYLSNGVVCELISTPCFHSNFLIHCLA